MRYGQMFLFVAALFLCFGCARPNVVKDTVKEIDFTVVVTRGNHSYVPVDISLFDRDTNAQARVLEILEAFEKNHPELEVTDWKIQTFNSHNSILGLWVDHQNRELPLETGG